MLTRMTTSATSRLRRGVANDSMTRNPSRSASSSAPKAWAVKVVESKGDYQQEAWIEEHVGGLLYQNQANLPRLTVPAVEDTLQGFLPTALPLVKSKEEENALLQAVERFPQQAQALQEALLQRQRENPGSSWLQHWWNTLGYLQVRDSVVINVSYYFHFKDDPYASTQVSRAAALLSATADFRKLVTTGTLACEKVGRKGTPLCSVAYKYMFNACRIPRKEQDSYVMYDPSRYSHCVVVCKGRFYKMDFCDPDKHDPLPVEVLEDGLHRILDMAEEADLPIGYMTSSDRDSWEAGYKTLVHEVSESDLEDLQSSAVLLALDDGEPVSRRACAYTFLHGNGYNRWFDKSIQLIVCKNGKAGLTGEHSMMDGMPVVNYADYVTGKTYNKCRRGSSPAVEVRKLFDDVRWSAVAPHVTKAKADFAEWTGRHEIDVQTFHGYGATFIKNAGYSPDAFVQMAIQVATYRLWGEQGGTYEATQVRPFLHGRTETTRSVSVESAAFVQAMGLHGNPDVDRGLKCNLLRDATKAHAKYIDKAAQGKGVDRHFLGLSLLANDSNSLPDLYADPVFARSKRWRVSTSNLTHPRLENWGYGEVVPDGVGLSYAVHPRHCNFGITALKEHGWTDELQKLLEDALLEMRTMLELENFPHSKL